MFTSFGAQLSGMQIPRLAGGFFVDALASLSIGSGSGSGMVDFGLTGLAAFAWLKSLILLAAARPPLAPFAALTAIFSCVFSQISNSFFCVMLPSFTTRNCKSRALVRFHLATVRPSILALSLSLSGTTPLRRHIAASSSK